MVFGTLPQLILFKLSKQELSGYDLVKSLEKDLGKRPSFGNIYPALKKLQAQRLITCKQEGRRKVYALSAKGKQELATFKDIHQRIVTNMIAESKACSLMSGADVDPLIEMLEKIKRGEAPFGKVTSQVHKTRNLLFQMEKEGVVERQHKEIVAILEEGMRRLESIREQGRKATKKTTQKKEDKTKKA